MSRTKLTTTTHALQMKLTREQAKDYMLKFAQAVTVSAHRLTKDGEPELVLFMTKYPDQPPSMLAKGTLAHKASDVLRLVNGLLTATEDQKGPQESQDGQGGSTKKGDTPWKGIALEFAEVLLKQARRQEGPEGP